MTAFERIYAVIRDVPEGMVTTYGTVARLAGNPRWARVVGYALHALRGNAHTTAVPWWRVLNRHGELCDTDRPDGDSLQQRKLEAEGIELEPNCTVDLKKYGWFTQ